MSGNELVIKPSSSELSSTSVAKFTSPTRRKQRKRWSFWGVDGIDVDRPGTFVAREDLVGDAMNLASDNFFLVVGSPPGTGKSSLLQLVIEKIKQKNEETKNNGGQITGYSLRVRPAKNTEHGFCLYKYVKERTGVCFETHNLKDDVKDCSEIWLLFDDAQKLYREECVNFWEDVVKQKTAKPFGKKTKVIVVVFVTYYLSSEKSSPVCFKNQVRLGISDLLLKKHEAKILFERRCMYPQWEDYFERLFYMTGGAAAAFTIAMNQITRRAQEVDRRCTDEELSESEAMEDLVENLSFDELKRCFPVVKPFDSVSHGVILDEIVNAYHADMGKSTEIEALDGDEPKPIRELIKAGIFTTTGRFTSPLAQRFYYQMVFPRAPMNQEPPRTLDNLIIEATRKLSARRLRTACQEIDGILQSPKEAVFQQLFHEAMASLLPVSYRIIPELGTKAEMNGKTVTGELDFYIKNGRKWALELLRDGKSLREHLSHIPGKYRNVDATSWLVVDCRMDSKPRTKEKNLCILVFDEEYESCKCYMRMKEEPFSINLTA